MSVTTELFFSLVKFDFEIVATLCMIYLVATEVSGRVENTEICLSRAREGVIQRDLRLISFEKASLLLDRILQSIRHLRRCDSSL